LWEENTVQWCVDMAIRALRGSTEPVTVQACATMEGSRYMDCGEREARFLGEMVGVRVVETRRVEGGTGHSEARPYTQLTEHRWGGL
jgi:hypothetical protein